jgi:hypothetical protein
MLALRLMTSLSLQIQVPHIYSLTDHQDVSHAKAGKLNIADAEG